MSAQKKQILITGVMKYSEAIPMILFISKHLKLNYWRVSDFEKILTHIKAMQN